MRKVEAFTDGSADHLGRGGLGGVTALGSSEKMFSGSEPGTTNNRMELRAALEALRSLKEPCEVFLHTDSEYLRKAFTEGWLEKWQKNGWKTYSKEPVKNQDLWLLLLDEIKEHRIDWRWVRGHAGHQENERVDKEAQRQRRSLKSG
ncbi:MAG: ribonuclease HI [Deinococcus sp.]|nr:ribonuclease HI [Deinococcus sp.]